jgi:subtilisin family serine protease
MALPELLRSGRAVLLRNALIDTALGAPRIPEHLRAAGDPGAYVVQARGAVSEEFRAMLGAAGAEIVSYVPNNAFLVRASAGAAGRLRASPWTQAVLPFEPYYKLDATLLRLAVRQELSPFGLLNVVSFPGQAGGMLAALKELGAEPVGEGQVTVLGEVWAVKVPADKTAAAAQIPEVQMLGVRFEKRLANDLTRVITRISTNIPFSTNVPMVRPPESHYRITNGFLTGEGVIVAVADTGVDETHPDLAGRILPGSYLGPGGKDFDGHGTHVIGTFIGDGTQSPLNNAAALGSHSNAVFSGMAPKARAWVQDYRRADSALQRETVVNGALISNNSWGFGGDNDYDIFAASYDAAVRDSTPGITGEQGVAYVFAAGNEGGGGDNGLQGIPGSVISPATGKNVITVGGSDLPRHITNIVFRCTTITNLTSTNIVCETNAPWAGMTDTNNQVAPFSSRGNVGIGIEGLFGRFKPDVVAPGAMLVSTRSKDYLEPDGITNTFDFQFNNISIGVQRTNIYTLVIPPGTIRFQILTVTNVLSPTNLTLGLGAGSTPAAAAVTLATNDLNLNATTTPALVPGRLYYSIANTNHAPNANFDVILLLTVTNNVGNYFDVLRQLNAPLKVGNQGYRYEAGTSMAAPAVSGFLALIQEYLATNFNARPSPALLKALAINGARSLSPNYNLQINAPINHQGWGLVNMSNSIPFGLTPGASNGPMRFYDQTLTNALATGGTETYEIAVPDEAKSFPLRVTLVWTDPPGNPVTGIKLVNDLNLSVLGDRTNTVVVSTNSSLTNSTAQIYIGNHFPPGSDFTEPIVLSSTDTNVVTPTNVTEVIDATRDLVNNVENVYIQPPLSSHYTVIVKGHRVNVNAVNSHTNGVVQDYALVISSGNVVPTNNVNLMVSGPLFTNDPTPRLSALLPATPDTNDPNATASAFLLDQRVGANSALIVSTNGATNQWAFFTYTNVPTADFTNVVILTFLPPNLSLARYREADIDLYVSRSSSGGGPDLFALDENAISAAAKSTRRGGSELLVFEDAKASEVFYIGVKSEDQQAANFSLFAASSKLPPSSTDSSNNIIVRALTRPAIIPDGSPEQPGGTNVMMVVSPRDSDQTIARAYVTNSIYHEEAGDLLGILNRVSGTNAVTLNNHRTWTEWENPTPPYGIIYDDSGEGDLGDLTTTPPVFLPDGPGRLLDFLGEPAGPFWNFTISDNALFHTGFVNDITLVLAPASTNTTDPNVLIDRRYCVPPNTWRYAAANIPNDAFNMETCVSDFGTPLPIQVFIREGDFPNFGAFAYHFQGDPPGECFDIGLGDNPPLFPGRWYIGLYNSNTIETVCVNLKVTISRKSVPGPYATYYSLDTPKNLLDDATTNSLIFVPDRGRVSDLRVGLRVNHERASDLVFHLKSPSGTSLLLAENRGGPFGTNYGASLQQSNVLAVSHSGGPDAVTNIYVGTSTEGTVQIDYDFQMAADRMTIYYESNLIYDTGFISGVGRFFVNYGPGTSTAITIVMNQGGNPRTDTVWDYTATLFSQFIYTTFTENTNLTDTPIKFGAAPFTNGGAFLRAGRRTVLYSNDFESVVGPEWSPATTNTTPGPPLHTGFLGNHVNDTLTFTFVSNQPPHSLIEVSFDLFIMNSWDGNIPAVVGNPGDDIWQWNFAGTNVLTTSFSNFEDPSYAQHQSYPGSFPTNNLPRTGAVLKDVFGIGPGPFNGVDAVYRITRVFPHSGGAIQMSFNGLNLQEPPNDSLNDEPWGIDNVVITALDPLDVKGSFYLPEEPITPFFGEQARGFWNLEVWDSRLGGAVVSTPQLVSWKLEIAFPQTNPPVFRLTNGSIFTTNIVGDQVYYFAVDVPCTSGYTTNTLTCLTPSISGLNLVFNQYVLPTNGPFDVLLLTNVTDSQSATNVLTNGFPPLVSTTRYYLAVSNADPAEVNAFELRTDFSKCGPLPLRNHEIRCTTIQAGEFQLYDYYVAPNAIGLIIQTFSADGNVDLYVQHLLDPVPVPATTNSAMGGTNNEYISFGANIGLFADGLWRIGVTNVEQAVPVNYCVRVTEFYDTDVTTLPLDSQVFGQTVTNINYYRVSLNPGCTSVEFKTESHNPPGILSIYVARERVPSPLDYDLFGTSDGVTPPLGPTLGAGYTPGVWYIAIINTNAVPIDFNVMVMPIGACFAPGPVIKASSASYSASGFKLEWSAPATEQYRVEFTDTLPPQWKTITNVISSDTGHFQYLDTSAQTNTAVGQRFYRLLRVQ